MVADNRNASLRCSLGKKKTLHDDSRNDELPEINLNANSTTGTTTRVRDVSPFNGMCPICISNCPIMCEISKSAFRGREVLYPAPEQFGQSTAGSNKDYGLGWGEFQIQTTMLGAEGIEASSDKALFPAADISTLVGNVPLKIPVYVAGLGSTMIAKVYWDSMAVGAAISGTIIQLGENVCGMDPESRIENGKVVYSKDLEHRVKAFREFWDGKHGDISVQTNVEDQRLGTDVYALSKLEVNVIERKWGQGAKAIGGEVRLPTLERALTLKSRGYLVIPDPEDESVQAAFKAGAFKTFERHSRVGMPSEEGFIEDIEWLREQGAKQVFLKTGAYRPATVAFTMKLTSEAKIDHVTFDGAGGGTGMSPVPMMNECSTPTVYLEAQVLKCAQILKSKGRHVPTIGIGGGFINETQILKSIALSNFGDSPFVKAIAMGRSPMTAAMKADYFAKLADEGKLPKNFKEQYGDTPDQFFLCASELQERYGQDFKKIPYGAIGLYTYWTDRIGVGLRQLLAATRKWKLDLVDRDDIASLSPRATKVTGIPLLEDIEQDAMEQILS